MNIATWLRARYPQLFTESHESVVVENCLCSMFSEKRKKEETILPRMSDDFDTRLMNLLQNEKIEQAPETFSTLRNLVENRNLQYSFSAVLVITLAFVSVSRLNKNESSLQESAGVVLENTSYLNEPASIDLSDNYQRKALIDHIKKEPGSIGGLRELELYYEKTGRGTAAKEIHYLIGEAEN
ncbi:hypothetical protein EHQ58_12355 [Leptospira ognonensis]|uniref:Uncharacterized protein n=1 Tax=Leptospira ognonensis TaxID=2484945 RepID=A0A4R9K220_9LEPT|nr:hypothetical protein [Leptospira ognonensis]TGL58165.1 hypothetical protein EHQ58_12355 [Leptospira ognonensis]